MLRVLLTTIIHYLLLRIAFVRSGRADAFEQDEGGFVAGVLGDEFAFESGFEDGLAKTSGAGETCAH